MSIIKLNPAFKDYLWGGTKLKENYGKKTDMDPVAESWELSVHPDGPSIVASGEYEGLSFPEYLEKKGKGVLGTKGNTFEFFPILIKFIDAKQPLSIQVHPDNEYALRVEHEYGKTEMWYILDCEPDSFLYFGVNKEITKEEFERRIQDNTLLDVLKAVPVHKGDVFFIKSGTIHAIGAGIQICEIQQNSNTTYRVYDFGRVGKDGKPRELGLWYGSFGKLRIFYNIESTLNGTTTLHVDDESFGSILLIEGSATIENDGTTLEANKGDSVFIDANSGDVKIQGNCQWIYSRV